MGGDVVITVAEGVIENLRNMIAMKTCDCETFYFAE
jgi:hypothetical protein